jgi:hypothetical protein
VPGPDGGGLHDRVFRALPGATSAAVDVAVTDSVDRVGDSKNALDSRHGLVGVGTVRGDSPAWGTDAVLAVIVYASEQPR